MFALPAYGGMYYIFGAFVMAFIWMFSNGLILFIIILVWVSQPQHFTMPLPSKILLKSLRTPMLWDCYLRRKAVIAATNNHHSHVILMSLPYPAPNVPTSHLADKCPQQSEPPTLRISLHEKIPWLVTQGELQPSMSCTSRYVTAHPSSDNRCLLAV